MCVFGLFGCVDKQLPFAPSENQRSDVSGVVVCGGGFGVGANRFCLGKLDDGSQLLVRYVLDACFGMDNGDGVGNHQHTDCVADVSPNTSATMGTEVGLCAVGSGGDGCRL